MTVAIATIKIAKEMYMRLVGSLSLSCKMINRASAVIAIIKG